VFDSTSGGGPAAPPATAQPGAEPPAEASRSLASVTARSAAATPNPAAPGKARNVLAAAVARLRHVVGLAGELRRRGTLVGQQQPGGVALPRPRLIIGELATIVEYRGGGLLRRVRLVRSRPSAAEQPPAIAAARGARPVMLLPGFATGPRRMERMALALAAAGHRVEDWGLGLNLGRGEDILARLCDAVVARAQAEGAPLALVGWSLGGLFAREVAKRHPDSVALVITLGTPFSGDLHANRGWRWYQGLTGHELGSPTTAGLASKPPVRTVALWSPRDGVVAARSACGRPGERDEAVALRCTHIGFPHHPQTIAEVLRQLGR